VSRGAGLTDDGLRRLGAVVASHVGDDRVPGLVALVAAGEEVHVEVAGSLTIGGPAVRRDSLFRIASTTKPVVGVATLALVEEGLLALDEPVDRLLPELADRRVLRRPDGPLDDTVPADRAVARGSGARCHRDRADEPHVRHTPAPGGPRGRAGRGLRGAGPLTVPGRARAAGAPARPGACTRARSGTASSSRPRGSAVWG
jgi:hypothetical protein